MTFCFGFMCSPKPAEMKLSAAMTTIYKVRITAPPVEGKANAHLLKYLAKVFGVGRDQIEITAGMKGRH